MGDDPELVQIHVVIPGKLAGAIVGKQGATIKALSEQTGCRMAVSSRTAGLGGAAVVASRDRRVMCVGHFPQCCIAQQVVYQAALQACEGSEVEPSALSALTAIFWIPKELSGAVIGKAGATLGHIREEAQVKVQFAKEEVKMMRPCSITGPLANVLQAETLIFNLLSSERQQHGSAKRPAALTDGGETDDPKRVRIEECTKLLVPARAAGAIIGKSGSGLGRIREECGVKVEMLHQAQAPHWTEDRVVILQGPPLSRQAAIVAVLSAAFAAEENHVVLKMLVSGPDAGAIIGKQGSTLKHIREQAGVSLQVEKEPVLGERLVTCSGSLVAVQVVVGLIMSVLSTSANGAGGNGNGTTVIGSVSA